MIGQALRGRFCKLIFCLSVLGVLCMDASTAVGQSVSGTVINNSEWLNNTNNVPPHWHVSPESGTASNGQGRVVVALFQADDDSLPLVDTGLLAPTNAIGTIDLSTVQGSNWVYVLGDLLSAGDYRVIAWIDGNANWLPDTGEPQGSRDVTVSEDSSIGNIIVTIEDDTDSDTLEDWWEVHWFDDLDQDRGTDFDNDGLTDGDEYDLILGAQYVEPDNWDTDADGLDDAWEIFYYPELDPTSDAGDSGRFGDPDFDTIINFDEYMGADGIGWRKDDDGDGIAEYTTSRDAMSPVYADSDQDGVSDANEFLLDLTHPTHSMSGTNFYPRSLEMSVGGTNGVDITDPGGPSSPTYAFGSDGGTVEFWVRPGAVGDGMIYGFTNVMAGVPHFRISLEDYRPRMDILNGSNIMASVGGIGADGSVQQLASNEWTHVACVIAPANNSLDLYVDGVLLIAQKSFIKPDFVLGSPTICQGFTDGYLDELRVWSYPRAAADIEYWAKRIYPAPGYAQELVGSASGRTVQMYDYVNPRPLIGYFRFDDGGPQVENFAFINYGLYPNTTPYYLPTSVVGSVTTDQAVPMGGSDDADGDGLPEWWVEIHNLEQYREYYSSAYGPIRVACSDDATLTDGFEYFRSFVGYASIGTTMAWIDGPDGDVFYAPKTVPDFYCGDHSSYTRYVYMFSQPSECPLNIFTPGMVSTIIYVNGTRVTTVGDEDNTVQSYDVTQYMNLGRNQIHVECESEVDTAAYYTDGSIAGVPYTISDYQAYDSTLPDAPLGCDNTPYEFKIATGKFDAELVCNGVPMVVRGDESRADPRSVWHCQIWSEYFERVTTVPIPDQENRAVPGNSDYGVPLNAERDNNPLDPDSADDNLDAVYEFITGTNPRDRDSNNNGVGDGDEDFDLDGLVNREEQRFGSDPWLPDSDDDGLIDGSDIGSAGHPAQSLSPQKNLSVSFGGTQSDFLEFPVEQRFALSKWTIEGWVMPDADEVDGGIVMQRSVSSNAVNYEVGLTASNTPYVRYVAIGGVEVRADSAVPVPADGATWTHLAASYYDRDLVLYVNGTNVASTTGAAFPALYAGGPLTQHVGRGFKGCIDELRLWSEERTAAEIILKRDEVLTGLEDTLVAYYRFDDGTSYTNIPPVVGTSANNGTNGLGATVAWAWGQVEDNVLQYSADWQYQWDHAASFNGTVGFSTNHIIVGPPQLQVFLNPDDAVDAGAAWSHNGGAAWNDSGHLETRLSPGDYEISFKDVDGWVAPDMVSLALVRGQSTTVTGIYEQTASLTVIIDNNTDVKTHATWSIDGGINTYGTGTRIDGLVPGAPGYDIIFSDISADVPGWDSPATIHIELLEAEERTITSEYTPVSGSLQITFTPDEAPTAARWQISGNTNWFGSGEIVTNLSYGDHTVEYNEVEWWQAPANETLAIPGSALMAIEREWTKLPEPTRIGAVLVPSNVVAAGAQWQMGGNTYNSGETVVVSSGTYTITFDEIDGYLPPLDMSVTADSESVIVTGTYYRADILGELGTGGAGALLNPRGIVVNGANVYVADSDNHQIQIYDQTLRAWRVQGSQGSALGQFRQPFGVAVDDDGNLWVADTGNHRIQRQDAATGVWSGFGSFGAGAGQFNAPYDVAVDLEGNVYVADYHNSRVQRRMIDGTWTVLIGSGIGDGVVRNPGALHLGSDGVLYVSDYNPATGVARIQQFTRAGAYLGTVGSSQDSASVLRRPMGSVLMANGDLLVADKESGSVPQYSASGDWSYVIAAGVLSDPHDVTADIWGNVFIADTGNGRILRLPAQDSDGDGIPDIYEDPIPQGLSIYPILEISDTLSSFPQSGGAGSFNAIGNVPWIATSDAAWAAVVDDGVVKNVSGPVAYVVSSNATLASRSATITVTGGGKIRTHIVSQPVPTTGNDYAGIGRSDLAIFDQATARWFIRDVAGTILAAPVNWGWPGVQAVAGDYNGDGADDLAVFDGASGRWYIRTAGGTVVLADAYWGWPGVEPLSGDYDGDGADDLAVFDQNTGRWFIRAVSGSPIAWSVFWGWPGVQPMAGDFDGDRAADLAIFDRQSARWFIRSLSGEALAWNLSWGWSGGDAVPGDYDGDGLADLAVFDQATGAWFIRTLAGTQLAWNLNWGWPGVRPVSGDFDGDGTHDLAIFDDKTGRWFVRSLTGGTLVWNAYWGWNGVQTVGR